MLPFAEQAKVGLSIAGAMVTKKLRALLLANGKNDLAEKVCAFAFCACCLGKKTSLVDARSSFGYTMVQLTDESRMTGLSCMLSISASAQFECWRESP